MSKEENENKSRELKDEFDRIVGENRNLDITKHIVQLENLQETPFGQKVEIYDYEKDITDCLVQAKEVLQSLANLYLSDNQILLNNQYVINKIREDADVYAEILFTNKMARKLLVSTLKRIDALDNNSRMIEVCTQSLKELRETIAFSSTQKTELEKFYKEMRKDFGLDDEIKSEVSEEPKQDASEGTILDARNLNDTINKYLKDKKI